MWDPKGSNLEFHMGPLWAPDVNPHKICQRALYDCTFTCK